MPNPPLTQLLARRWLVAGLVVLVALVFGAGIVLATPGAHRSRPSAAGRGPETHQQQDELVTPAFSTPSLPAGLPGGPAVVGPTTTTTTTVPTAKQIVAVGTTTTTTTLSTPVSATTAPSTSLPTASTTVPSSTSTTKPTGVSVTTTSTVPAPPGEVDLTDASTGPVQVSAGIKIVVHLSAEWKSPALHGHGALVPVSSITEADGSTLTTYEAAVSGNETITAAYNCAVPDCGIHGWMIKVQVS